MSIIQKAMDKRYDAWLQRRSLTQVDPLKREDLAQPPPDMPSTREAGRHPKPIATTRLTGTNTDRAPVAQLGAGHVVRCESPDPQVMEEFRRIKRPLLTKAFGKDDVRVERGNVIMVTSSVPGEGKSFTAINLSLSMVLERDHTALLIDADSVKRNVSRQLELDGRPGLIDVLLDNRLDFARMGIRTQHPGLVIVPAGHRHAHATEILASSEMERLVSTLAERYSDTMIIFDSAPLLATTQAQVLAELVGQVVVVVEADRTPQHVVKEGISTLSPTKPINLILNKSQHSFGRDYPRAYYADYYGHEQE
ncbi:MAG: AAA family ATPase [Acidiferrobacterales bacterium]